MAIKDASPKQDDRVRNWCLIVYPESAPENWREVLDDMHIMWIESPLHDKDINADGEPKKPHYHILLLFENKQPYQKVLDITKQLNTVVPQKCSGAKGTVRYMAHLDNPEKFQYSVNDIVSHGGADVSKYLTLTAGNRYQCIKEMCEFIDAYDVREYQDIVNYAMEERFDDWFRILCDNGTMIISNYIKSQRHREGGSRFVRMEDGNMGDMETGEILKTGGQL